MNKIKRLQLTYIPFKYWNEELSGFKLKLKQKDIPKNVSFFLLWTPLNNSEVELIKQIKIHFPNIPPEKLLTCEINLALPFNLFEKNAKSYNFFKINKVIGKLLPIAPAIRLLFQLQLYKNPDNSKILDIYSNSIKIYAFLIKLVFELLNRGNFIPILEPQSNGTYIGKWKLILRTEEDNDRFKKIVDSCPWTAFNLPVNFIPEKTQNNKITIQKTNALWNKSYIFLNLMNFIADYLIRNTLQERHPNLLRDMYSYEIQKEKRNDLSVSWDYKFLKSLITHNRIFELQKFSETIVPKIIENWVQNAQGFINNRGISFVLELEYPEVSDEKWHLNFYLKSENYDKKYFLKEIWEGNASIKKEILEFFDSEDQLLEQLYRAFGICSKIFKPIKRILDVKTPSTLLLNPSEVMEFLRYPKDLLIQSGFKVILPIEFTKGGARRLNAKLIIRSKNRIKKKSGSSTSKILPSLFNLDNMLEYKWQANLEGEDLSDDEFKNIIETKEPLIKWRGKWILVEQEDIEEFRTLFNKNEVSGSINYIEALKLGLTSKKTLQENKDSFEVIIQGDLNDIIENIKSLEQFEDIETPKSFKGILRPYQKEGLKWMANMCNYNFGICLADDMGLGKTIQIIALLLHFKENYPNDPGAVLIVCPTSILFNWEREIKKFAPKMDILLHHGPERIKDLSKISEFLKNHRIILTSYGTLRNDIDFLETINFNGVILDESQNIKNFSSKQSQAAYKLKSRYRICLSGTPIENNLMELWALFKFLNPGLLGKRNDFQKKYIIPIERFQDQYAIENLRQLINPFILRRVKTDKAIINDLPEKNEIKEYIELTEVQVKLYKDLVEKTLKEIEEVSSDKKKKKGLILKVITQLKQICNHPNHYLRISASSYDFEKNFDVFLSQSQKMKRLIELTEEVIANSEKVLIFTQFRKMGELIEKALEQKFSFEILYLHGGVPERKRKEIVDKFQNGEFFKTSILILSLKAGGIGLNLTRGTTVIHYDRWWNPAIENQATDRAYRIGQKSQVNVYKFVSIGTIEEKIDKLLEEKKELTEKIIVSSGESWISDLSDEKLRDLLILKEKKNLNKKIKDNRKNARS
ncbi:MAG: DEAD/DEAH box helicase [Promethearchaeota archaeon]